MLRVLLAAFLLRSTNATVFYTVKREWMHEGARRHRKLQTFTKLKDARAKYRKVRCADTDTITITVEACVAQRVGEIHSSSDIQ